jgi:hypothetical protein
MAEHRRTNAAWERMRVKLERSLPVPVGEVRRALHALDDAVTSSLAEIEAKAERAA